MGREFGMQMFDQALLAGAERARDRSGRRLYLRHRQAPVPEVRHRHQHAAARGQHHGRAAGGRLKHQRLAPSTAWRRSINSWKRSSGDAAPICTSSPRDPPRIRMYGELTPLRGEPLTPDFVKDALYEIMPRKADRALRQPRTAPISPTRSPGKGRFRVNVMRQLNGMGAVFRAIPSQALTLDELEYAAAVTPAVSRQQRTDPGHRQDRLGQVDLARGDDRRHQQAHQGPHPHDRGSDRVRACAPATA